MADAKYDAVVVGSGPNGLAAAITMQRRGLSVLLIEARGTIGGGTRTAELTLPGFLHDVCSAIHPMAAASPFFQSIPMREYGLELIDPPVAAAHPFDDGEAAVLLRSFDETAWLLGEDEKAYRGIYGPLLDAWPYIAGEVLGPIGVTRHPFDMARFGLLAMRSAKSVASRYKSKQARGLFAGMAAHSFLPLTSATSAAIGLVLSLVGHTAGWPLCKGGSQSLAGTLARYFLSLGGVIETNREIANLDELPQSKAILLDVTPRQLLDIAGDRLSELYRRQMERYRYGMGVFKVDWALSSPAPFMAEQCRAAGTVHLGGTFEEIASSEHDGTQGRLAERPFVLFAQQSVFDSSRAPEGKQVAWAYCHVPNGSVVDRTEAIESQVERFAPGFRDCILARHTMNTSEMHAYNPNYIGGDINGGVIDLFQLFTRPALRSSPYRTSVKGLYLCSASTPPGGGVHGMCGYHAASRALQDCFPDLGGEESG
jgi:phytoene dehydrogenase-like protein